MVWWFCAAKCQILTAAAESLTELSSNCGFGHERKTGAQSARHPSASLAQNMVAVKLIFICPVPLCQEMTSKQNKITFFKQNIQKSYNDKAKKAHWVIVQSFRDAQSISPFPRVCYSGESVFQSVALSADPASVSQQRLPQHQRLQRGGGGWANVSQGLLRSPSTEKYAGGGEEAWR